jgi:UDP-3-O-[3-hydroxymyristoyl] glucosamine N-acyltransferase
VTYYRRHSESTTLKRPLRPIMAKQILEVLGDGSRIVSGDADFLVSKVTPINLFSRGSLTFSSGSSPELSLLKDSEGILITEQKVSSRVLESLKDLKFSGVLIEVPEIRLCMSQVLCLFDDKLSRFTPGVSSLAQVSASAKIGSGCAIGPFVFVGENVEIGNNVAIGAGSVLETSAKIGDNTIIHPLVVIGAHCEVGRNCEIHSNTTIGSDGFGFVKNSQKNNQKIPQIGNVVIEEDVEIGANCSIDRATLASTIIRRNSKLDNQVHIAHNCELGERSLVAASFRLAGSSKIGRDFIAGGDVSVADHITISDSVTLGGRTGVTKDITESGAYLGFPAQPYKVGLKNLTAFRNLHEMQHELRELQNKIKMLESCFEKLQP